MPMIFFKDWSSLLRVLVTGVLAYAALVALLRTSGKRTLAQMNVFDFVVTVAFGSTLATVLLSRDVPLADGVAAFAILIFLQLAVAWLSVRSPFFSGLVKSRPRLLLHDGRILAQAMREARMKEEELLQAVRNQGIASLAEVTAVVLETNGSLSVIRRSDEQGPSTFGDLRP
jgi:uncharacterized membrane protein YcaP (DUF421 family)